MSDRVSLQMLPMFKLVLSSLGLHMVVAHNLLKFLNLNLIRPDYLMFQNTSNISKF